MNIVSWNRLAALRWTSKVASGQDVTVLEHNSMVVTIAALRDFIANPSVVMPDRGEPHYPTLRLDGEALPVIGIQADDCLSHARNLWLASLDEFLFRLGSATQTECLPEPESERSERVAIAGRLAAAALIVSADTNEFAVREIDSINQNGTDFVRSVMVFAASLLRLA